MSNTFLLAEHNNDLVNLSWTITAEEAVQYIAELESLHANTVQPQSAWRKLESETGPFKTVTTFTYTKRHDGVVELKYEIHQRHGASEAECHYAGLQRDLGYGRVGPFSWVQKREDIIFTRYVA